MKKRRLVLFTLVVALLATMLVPFSASAARAQVASETTVAGKISAPITVDGVKDAIWDQVTAQPLKTTPYVASATYPATRATVSSLYDDSNFYFYIDVTVPNCDIVPDATWEYIQINIGEGDRAAMGGIDSPEAGKYYSTNYTIKLLINETSELQHLETASYIYAGTPSYTVSGIPVDIDYFVKYTATGYVVEMRYGLNHMLDKNGVERSSVTVKNENTGATYAYVPHTQPVPTKDSTLPFEIILLDRAGSAMSSFAFYSFARAANTPDTRTNFDWCGWLQFGDAVSLPAPAPTTTVYGQNIALEDNVIVRFYVDIAEELLAAGGSVTLTVDRPDGMADTVKTYAKLTDGATYEVGEKTYYYYSIGVSAKQYTDNIILSVKDKDGVEVATKTYSVEEYCYDTINDAAAAATLKTLCTDMLQYGASAQTHFNYRTDKLATYRLGNG